MGRASQKGTSGRTNDSLEAKWGKGALMEKQMRFWKDEWALRRLDGRYDSFVTVSIWMWYQLLSLKEKIGLVPRDGIL